VSNTDVLLGIQATTAKYAAGDDTTLVFPNQLPDGSGGTQAQPRPAYAVYEFSSQTSSPLGVHVLSGTNTVTPYWLGLANWRTGRWEFWPGSHLSSTTAPLNSGAPGDYLSPDGRVAVALVVTDLTESVDIYQLELYTAEEAPDFSASSDRWDGVKLTWTATSDVTAYRLWRRPADSPDAPYDAVNTGTEYPRYTADTLDREPEGGRDFDYLLQTAYLEPIDGKYVKLWSAGTSTTGRRRDNELDPAYAAIDAYAPAAALNQLGFVINQSDATGNLLFVKSDNYPPSPDWHEQPTTDGSPLVEGLLTSAEWPRPFYAVQAEVAQNPAISMVYSTADGVFSRVGAAADDGSVVWSDPSQAREAGNYLLAVCQLPHMLGAITWSDADQALEMNNSFDAVGGSWYRYGLDGWPWYQVGSRRPDGSVDVADEVSQVWLCYREAGTGKSVVVEEHNSNWNDISPDLVTGPNPKVRHILVKHSLAPALGVFYLTPDQHELRLVRQPGGSAWDTADAETLVTAPDGQQLGDFTLYIPSITSSGNYLLYSVGGNLYAQFSTSAGLAVWSKPRQLASAQGIHDVHVQVVGYGPEFSAGTYAIWLADTADGPRIEYYDLASIDFLYGSDQ
jgi:hypothetical protein